MRITHIISGLEGGGGAPTMLFRLLAAMGSGGESEVISLTGAGEIGESIKALGVSVRALNWKRGALPSPADIWRFAASLRDGPRPDVIHAWLYHSNLIAWLVAAFAGHPRLIWQLCHTNLDPHLEKRLTIWCANAGGPLSHVGVSAIICDSQACRQVHRKLKYSHRLIHVIPSGFDLNAFRPDPFARASVRRELEIGENSPVIGLVARYHPQKDHGTFLRSAALLASSMPEARFVLCGRSVDASNQELRGMIEKSNLERHCRLLGMYPSTARLMAAMDIATSSSCGESFSLMIGEAMSSGLPCVVTDVGDSAHMVGGTGAVVPPNDPEAMAAAWVKILGMTAEARAAMGRSARERVRANWSLPVMAARYRSVYQGGVPVPDPLADCESAL